MDHLPKIIESLISYLSKRDKDTFIFGFLALLTLGALAVGAPAWPTVVAGFGFVGCYILMRYALLRVQMRENEHQMKTIPAQHAEDIIASTVTDEEKIALEIMRSSVRTSTKDLEH